MTNPKDLVGKDVTLLIRGGVKVSDYYIKFAILEQVGTKYYTTRTVRYYNGEQQVLNWTDKDEIEMTHIIEGHNHTVHTAWVNWKQELRTYSTAREKERFTYRRGLELTLHQELDTRMKQWDAEHPYPPAPLGVSGVFGVLEEGEGE